MDRCGYSKFCTNFILVPFYESNYQCICRKIQTKCKTKPNNVKCKTFLIRQIKLKLFSNPNVLSDIFMKYFLFINHTNCDFFFIYKEIEKSKCFLFLYTAKGVFRKQCQISHIQQILWTRQSRKSRHEGTINI